MPKARAKAVSLYRYVHKYRGFTVEDVATILDITAPVVSDHKNKFEKDLEESKKKVSAFGPTASGRLVTEEWHRDQWMYLGTVEYTSEGNAYNSPPIKTRSETRWRTST